jgi:nickel transport protein
MKQLFLILILAMFAYAHKLNIFTDYQNGVLFVQSYYASGDACAGCVIKIQDANNAQIYDGVLDANGKSEIKINLPDSSKVIVSASGGHLVEANLGQSLSSDSNITKDDLHIDNARLKQMIEASVAKEVRPILVELDKSHELSLEKIFSGLGYILGFFGIWALMRQKQG